MGAALAAVNVTCVERQHPDQIGGETEHGDQAGGGWGHVGGAEKHISRQYKLLRPKEALWGSSWGGGAWGVQQGNGEGRGPWRAFEGVGCGKLHWFHGSSHFW